MAPPRHVIVAGAGVAGLTAALAMERAGLRVTVLEQAEKLEEAGAGIQLSPNATRALESIGLGEKLKTFAGTPEALRVMAGRSGREIARIPLGNTTVRRYGAPYLTMHRADLQQVLADAARAKRDISLKLGVRVEDFAAHNKGVTVLGRRGSEVIDERGIALIGADGVWSSLRPRITKARRPRFARRTAWRALVPAADLPGMYRAPFVHLWLGLDAHLVHYPVKSGALVNIVGIVHEDWNEPGWSAKGERDVLLRHFARWSWSDEVRELLSVPPQWLKWALYEGRGPLHDGSGPVTLIGDAAHAILPFLAQGAGMAIEDAAVLAFMLGKYLDEPADALRGYEGARFHRIARVQKMSRSQGRVYGMSGPEALIRNAVMVAMGGENLLKRFDWLYSWRAPEFAQPMSHPL
jgi:2-polyprenyl-6-methoxyphenol hydroxylase-like FAD-dependent oxidoreductase